MSLAALTEGTERAVEPLDFWTPEGLRVLGQILARSRSLIAAEKKVGLSQRELSKLIECKTGRFVSDRTIGNIEGGQVEPKHNTVAILAAAEFLIHPLTDQLLSRQAINEIACGRYNPYEGNRQQQNEKIGQTSRYKRVQSPVTLLGITEGRVSAMVDGLSFSNFLQAWCQRQSPPLSLSDFFELLAAQLQAYASDEVDLESLKRVCQGSQKPTEDEVGFLGTILRDDQGLPYAYQELLAIAGLNNHDESELTNHRHG
jgi:DNA-binding XRE family transcriptional regulator